MADNTNKSVVVDVQVNASNAINQLAAYRDAITQLKNQEKELNGVALEQSIQKRKQLQSVMNDYQKQLQNQLNAQSSLQRSTDKLNDSYNGLSAKYKFMKQRINEMSSEERKANAAYIEESKKVYERMKEMQSETGKMQLNVGNYEQSILGALGANNGFATSLLNISKNGGGISGAFSAMGTAAKSFGASLLTLMANPVFLAIAGVAAAGMAFKWFYDYNQGIAEATRLTREFSGLAGNELKGVRDEIQAMADTFGHDYKDVLTTVDGLVAQYGMSWQEANQIVQDGFVSGADLSGNMLDKINQYAPAFHDAGISASEMVAIIQQTRSGILTDDGLALIQKASKSLRNMSTSTVSSLEGIGISATEMQTKLTNGSMTMMEAIQEVSEHLKGVSANSQEAGAVIDDVFGKKGVAAGEQQIKALADIETNLEAVKETTGEYGKMQEEAVETDKELNDVLSAMFDMSDQGWETMIGNIKIMCKKWLIAFLKGVVSAINYMIDWYNDSVLLRLEVNGLIAIFKNVWSVVKFVFGAAVDVVKSFASTLRGLGNIVEGVFTADVGKITSGWDILVNGFKSTVSAIAKDAKTLGREIYSNTYGALEETANGHLNHIELSSFDGGGSSGSSSGGGGSSSAGSSSGSKSTGKGGKSGSKSTGKKTGKTEAEKAAEKAAKDRATYEAKIQKQLDDELNKIAQEGAKKNRETLNKIYEDQIKDLEAKQAKEKNSETQTYKNLTELIKLKKAEQTKALKEFDDQQLAEQIKNRQAIIQNQLEGLSEEDKNDELGRQLRLQALQLEEWNELQALELSEEAKQAIREKYQQKRLALNKEYDDRVKQQIDEQAQAEVERQQEKYDAIGGLMSSFGDLASQFSDKSKALAVAAKTLAIGEVLLSQGVAIAKAVQTATSSSATWIDMLAAITTVVASVTAVMSTAMKSVNSASFSTGGYVSGAGTGTSDSISARLSNGESVINARSTAAFAPLLSAINTAGGGVPINVQDSANRASGEAMLQNAMAKAFASMPSPVVSVREIANVQNRVKVIESISTL